MSTVIGNTCHTAISEYARENSHDITMLGTRNVISLVDGDAIFGRVRFFPAGNDVHMAPVITYRDCIANWKTTWDDCREPTMWPMYIPRDIHRMVADYLGHMQSIFQYMLLLALRRDNIAEVVNAFQHETCWKVLHTNSRLLADCKKLIAAAPYSHRRAYNAILKINKTNN